MWLTYIKKQDICKECDYYSVKYDMCFFRNMKLERINRFIPESYKRSCFDYRQKGENQMQEFQCTKCGKLLANIFDSDAIAVMVEREAIEQVELHHNSNHIKSIEIKCPQCQELNNITV